MVSGSHLPHRRRRLLPAILSIALHSFAGVAETSAFVTPSFRVAVVSASVSTTRRKAAVWTPSTSSTRLDHAFPTESSSSSPSSSASSSPRPAAYGEASRQFRRTIYGHADWLKHRSPNRFYHNFKTMRTSGILRNVAPQIVTATSVAAFVCLWNVIFPANRLGIPLTFFTITNPALGLLLVFRTNTSYSRWDEARKFWGLNINRTRDLVRMGNSFYDRTEVSENRRQEDLFHLSSSTWAFVRSMKRHLSPFEDEEDFRREIKRKLPPQQAAMLLEAEHRPNRALFDLSMAIENLPMHFLRKQEMHSALTKFEDTLGGCERLLTSPVPLLYTRHLTRFLWVWLVFLPFGLYDAFKGWRHFSLIPATAVISMALFGIEELATQLEEPFTILPMQAFCDKIGKWCDEIISWHPNDNGRKRRETFPEHSEFPSSPTRPQNHAFFA